MSPAENGFIGSVSVLSSEKSVEELIQQPLLQGIDDHLIEFSEALRSESLYSASLVIFAIPTACTKCY